MQSSRLQCQSNRQWQMPSPPTKTHWCTHQTWAHQRQTTIRTQTRIWLSVESSALGVLGWAPTLQTLPGQRADCGSHSRWPYHPAPWRPVTLLGSRQLAAALQILSWHQDSNHRPQIDDRAFTRRQSGWGGFKVNAFADKDRRPPSFLRMVKTP